MIKPKEKAEELNDMILGSQQLDNLVSSSLICIDEILEALEHNTWQNKDYIDYYKEVKQEIEKL